MNVQIALANVSFVEKSGHIALRGLRHALAQDHMAAPAVFQYHFTASS
jgi:hypothetical protein